MALNDRDIERVIQDALELEQAWITELAQLLLQHLQAGEWSELDEVALLELQAELERKVTTVNAKHQDEIQDGISESITETLIAAVASDIHGLKRYYKQEPEPILEPKLTSIANQVAQGVSNTIRRRNVAMSDNAVRAWCTAAIQAMQDIQQNGLSFDRAISKAVESLGRSFRIRYASGKTTSPDVALRRLMTTEMSQAGGRMTLECMESYGHELAVTSTHYGARPSHAVWQGKPFGIHGAVTVDGVDYPGMEELTDYGSVTGLKGVNCRHSIYPYYPGITELPDRDFEAEKAKWHKSSNEFYEATQRQRELERRIRSSKSVIADMEQAGLGLESPDYVQKRLVLGRQQRELKAFLSKNNLPRQPLREKAYGVAKQPRALSADWNVGSRVVDSLKSTKYGKTNPLKVKGVSATLFNNQINAINKIAGQIPILDESLKKYGLIITSSKIDGVAYTRMRNGKWEMVFNTETFSSKANLKADVWENIKNGYFMPATKSGSSSYPAVHELGHILQKSIVEKELGANYTYYQYKKMADKHQEEIMNIVNSNKGRLSEYAKENSRDFFAECFANLNCGQPNEYGIALSEFLKQRGLL